MNLQEQIGTIRPRRRKLRISQVALAEAAKISREQLINIELGKTRDPRSGTLDRIHRALSELEAETGREEAHKAQKTGE